MISGARRESLRRLYGYTAISLLSAGAFVPLFAILIYIVVNGAGRLNWQFIFEFSSSMQQGGIWGPVIGTILLTILTMVIAVPLAILVAVFMAEYTRKNLLSRIIQLTIINLSSIPSVVYGLFGLGIFVILLQMGVSLIAGALTLAILIMPLIVSVSYQALASVPDSLRQASLAVGASKLQTTFRIVIPAASPSILTGIILSTARVAGETAPVLFTAAAYSVASLPSSIFHESMLLPYHLYSISTQVKDAPPEQKFGVALVLMVVVLLLNILAILLRKRLRKKLRRLTESL